MTESIELSERELEILQLVATGASNKEIAQQLFISANTVKVHLRNIFSKIEVTSRTEAAMYAVSNGLVTGVSAPVEEEDEPESEDLEAGAPVPGYETSPKPAEVQPNRGLAVIPRSWIAFGVMALIVIIAGTYGIARGYILQQTPASPPALPIDASSPRWQTKASLPTARSGLALASYENAIYAIAGRSEQGVTGVVERYDPEADTWTTLTPKPTPVDEVSAGLIGGKVYIPGGILASGEATNILEYYDLREDSWGHGASMPQALSGYALVAYEGKLYLFGGWDGRRVLDTVYEYDPTQDSWAVRSPMPEPKAYAGAVVASGRIFLLGGYNGSRALRTNYLYSPEEEVPGGKPWQRLLDLPQGRYAMGIASVADIIYIAGGESEAKTLPYLEYIIPTNDWATFEPLDEQAWAHGGLALLGTNLHMIGGMQNQALTTQHLAYKAVYILNMPVVR